MFSPADYEAFERLTHELRGRFTSAGIILAANPTFAAVLGMRDEEFAGRSLLEFVSTDDREALPRHLAECCDRAGAAVTVHLRMRAATGESGSYSWILQAIGERGIYGVGRRCMPPWLDPRRSASANAGDLLSDAAFEGIAVHEAGRILDANRALAEMLGYRRDELVGRSILDFAAPQSRDAVRTNVENQVERPYRAWGLRKDGAVFPAELAGKAVEVDGRTLRVTSIRDLSEHERIESALQASEAWLRQIIDLAPVMIFAKDREGRILLANRATAEAYGTTVGELVGRRHDEVHPVAEELQKYRADDVEVIDSGRPRHIPEQTFQDATGAVRIIETTKIPHFAPDRNERVVLGVSRDITERKRTQEALQRAHDDLERRVAERTRELAELNHRLELEVVERKRAETEARQNEARFRALAETVAAATFIFSGTGISYVNPAAARITGFSREELLAKNFWDLIHPEMRDLVYQRGLARLAGLEEPESYEVRIVTRSGESKWVAYTGSMIEFGGTPAVLGTAFDITDRRAAEDALRESEQRYRTLSDLTSDGVFHFSLTPARPATLTWASDGFTKLTGYGVDEFNVAGGWRAIVHPEDQGLMRGLIRAVMAGRDVFEELRAVHREGILRWVRIAARPELCPRTGAVVGVLGAATDISERKRAEAALRASEARLHRVTDAIPGAVYQYRLSPSGEQQFLFVSAGVAGLLEHAAEKLQADFSLAWDQIEPDHADEVRRAVEHSAATLQPWNAEFRVRTPSGQRKWLRGSSIPEPPDGEGRIVWNGILVDVTEQKRAAELLQEQFAQLSTLVENLQLGILVEDGAGTVLHVNDTFCELFSAGPPDQLIGTAGIAARQDTLLQFVDAEAFMRTTLQRLSERRKVTGEELALRDGRTLERDYVPIRDGQTYRGHLWIYRDITSRKRAEELSQQRQERLSQAARLGMLGGMASTLAHELNQPLCAIASYVQASLRLLVGQPEAPATVVQALQKADAQTRRAAEIVERVRNFLRNRAPARESTDMNGIVRDACESVQPLVRKSSCELALRLARNLPPVLADPLQVELVLLNLVRNALEAVADQPRGHRVIHVTTRRVRQKREIEVRVTDSGPAQTQNQIRRFFEPFYSTKADGMGLGLAISRSIIEAHNGRIWAVAEPRQGTSVHFTIPTAHQEDRHV